MTSLASRLRELEHNPDFVNLRSIRGVRVDLRYATDDNFTGRNVYGDFTEPFLHRLAADKLRQAVKLLTQLRPGTELLVFDALRPRSAQRVLWAHVVGTPQEIYVADPDRGSMHNYGCAIDLGLADERGRALDMGTAFDTFYPLSQPKLEEEFFRQGHLSAAQLENRRLLRRAMTEAGFLQLPHEWWHYDAYPQAEVRSRFQLIE